MFITFFLSQLGVVRHWSQVRGKEAHWEKKLFINGLGMILTLFILLTVTILKFFDGGWITLILTGSLITIAMLTQRHYRNTYKLLHRLDELVSIAESSCPSFPGEQGTDKELKVKYDPQDKTAALLVNGFKASASTRSSASSASSAERSRTSCSSRQAYWTPAISRARKRCPA